MKKIIIGVLILAGAAMGSVSIRNSITKKIDAVDSPIGVKQIATAPGRLAIKASATIESHFVDQVCYWYVEVRENGQMIWGNKYEEMAKAVRAGKEGTMRFQEVLPIILAPGKYEVHVAVGSIGVVIEEEDGSSSNEHISHAITIPVTVH